MAWKCLILAALMVGCCLVAGDDCTGKADGTITSHACRAYTYCQDERPKIKDCWEDNKVFNEKTMGCDYADNLEDGDSCKVLRDCSEKEDGNYADLFTQCRMFYTCYKKLFYGHQYCQNGLVFDERYGICNFKAQVPPPCGTA